MPKGSLYLCPARYFSSQTLFPLVIGKIKGPLTAYAQTNNDEMAFQKMCNLC